MKGKCLQLYTLKTNMKGLVYAVRQQWPSPASISMYLLDAVQ
jgi:hypothetical protein